MIYNFLKIVIFTALFVIMSSCSGYKGAGVGLAPSSGLFAIFLISHHDIDTLPYDYNSEVWSNLLENPPISNILIADDEIESYYWQRQALLLTRSASIRFTKEYVRDLNGRSFMVALENNPVFAGSFIEPASARAIRYPVIYISRKGKRVIFCIRPEHSLSTSHDTTDQILMERLAPDEVKSYFRRQGKLRQFTDQSDCR